ncbi:hypothetical protein EY02_14720, partial [Staphylococcus aureus]
SNRLRSKIIGQDQAVEMVSRAIRRNRAGFDDGNRPIGSFLFVGPTGVGKTELAKQLAIDLFGNKDALIRLDMSEYSDTTAVSKMIGTTLSDQLDAFIGGTFTDSVKTIMNYLGVIPFLQDLITDGIIAGVGSVLVFVPQIVVL